MNLLPLFFALSAQALALDDIKPYFQTGPAAPAMALLRAQDYAAAQKQLAEYVSKHGRAKDIHQARFLLGYAALKAGDNAQAEKQFSELERGYPLLVDYHRVWAARAIAAQSRSADVLTRLKKVAPTSILDGEARLLRAEALRALSRFGDAANEYKGYVESYPDSWRIQEARFRWAEMLDQSGNAAEAQKQFRRVYVQSPSSNWGKNAKDHIGEAPLESQERVDRAMALFDGMRNAESEAEWAMVLASDVTPDLRCVAQYHLAQSVFKQRDRRRAAPLFETAAASCENAKNEDLSVKSFYQAGRSYSSYGDNDASAYKKAVTLFDRVWRKYKTHSYADDARVRQADVLDALKQEADAEKLLGTLPDEFPTGDQKGEALWRLGLRALRKGDHAEAQKWLQKGLETVPREEGWWEAGRTRYWLGRVSQMSGNSAQALTHYERAIREYPLSVYCLLSLNRLRDMLPDDAERLVTELTKDAGDAVGWKFAVRPLFEEPGFRRGVELMRLGLGAEAKREFAQAGLKIPNKRGTKVAPADEENLWLAAVLYDRAGEVGASHFIPRHLLTAYERDFPVGENRKRWLISYPRGYAELIEKNTAAPGNGQPAALQFAIVREESAFDPNLESFANAVGLTQLTAAPAARFANGLPHDRQALRDPVINVTIGARELGFLWNRYGGNPPLAIAAYNAGEGAVGRWLRDPERKKLPLDLFMEWIPFDETRGYTKRVLASYFAYTWLYAHKDAPFSSRVPSVKFELPKSK